MKRSEALYSMLPVPAQNVLATVKGLQLKLRRNRGKYPRFRREIADRAGYSMAEMQAWQRDMLSALLNDAVRHVPYYRENYSGPVANYIESEGLERFPILTKEALRGNELEFTDGRVRSSRLLELHTTGTTGTPLRVYCTSEDRQLNYAFYDEYLVSIGIDPRGRRLVMGGRVVVPQRQWKPPYWRYSWFQNSMLVSSYHIGGNTFDSMVNAITRFQPHYVDAYPSSVYALASLMAERGVTFSGIKGVVTSGETLDDEQREVIERAFGAPVFDQYGCAEMAVFAGQCPYGRYHVKADYGVVEVVKDDGSAADGESGDLVVTGLVNRTMPLIRYAVGEVGAVEWLQCECGGNGPVLTELQGRKDDAVVTPDGRRIGRLSPVLKGFPIGESQYVQDEIGVLQVRVVPADGFDEHTKTRIVEEVQRRVGRDMQIVVQPVQRIDRGPGGKLKSVISRV